MIRNEIIIWDLEGYPSRKQNSSVLLWQNYGSKDKAKFISIPQFIEENSKELRDRYLSWVQKFGEESTGSKKIFENFYIRDDFSFWWMTDIVEKNNWGKSPLINDIIKIFAMEKILLKAKFDVLRVYTKNKNLIKCLKIWCFEKKITFKAQFITTHKQINLKTLLYS